MSVLLGGHLFRGCRPAQRGRHCAVIFGPHSAAGTASRLGWRRPEHGSLHHASQGKKVAQSDRRWHQRAAHAVGSMQLSPPRCRPPLPPACFACPRVPPSPCLPARPQVLFCGRDMHYGYVFTKEALQGDAGVEVRGCSGGGGSRARLPPRLLLSPNRSDTCACNCMYPPQVHQCDRGQVAHELRTADVAVPLMARLDAQVDMALCSLLFAEPSKPGGTRQHVKQRCNTPRR